MRSALGLFITACALVVSTQAHGQTTIDVAEPSSYLFPDLNIVLDHRPVTQIDGFGTSGKLSYGGIITYGPDQYGKELDLSSTYTTNAGKTQIALTAQDDFLNGPGGMFNIKNNVLELHADFYRPFSKGTVTVGPVFQAVQAIAVRNFPSYTLFQPGLRGEWTPTNKLTVDGDIRDSIEPAHHRSNWRMNVSGTYQLTKHVSFQADIAHIAVATAYTARVTFHF